MHLSTTLRGEDILLASSRANQKRNILF